MFSEVDVQTKYCENSQFHHTLDFEHSEGYIDLHE